MRERYKLIEPEKRRRFIGMEGFVQRLSNGSGCRVPLGTKIEPPVIVGKLGFFFFFRKRV